MEFRPLHDRVMVRRIEEDAKTAGGIIIPDTAKEKPQQGEVIAIGPGARDKPAQSMRSTSGLEIAFCLASGRAVKSRSTVRIS